MHRSILNVIFPIFLLGSMGCGGRRIHEFRGSAMGTFYTVKLVAEQVARDELERGIQARVSLVDALMSNWKYDSDVSRFNGFRDTGPMELSPHSARVIRNALEIADLTEGALDPTLGPLIELWGFGAQGSVSFPETSAIEMALKQTGYEHLRLEGRFLRKSLPNVTLNLSANAKGYAVDLLADYLHALGFHHFMVDIGGDVRVSGRNPQNQPWRMAIEKPDTPIMRSVFHITSLEDKAMATSGDYRNFFMHEGQRYSHILDPRTGMPILSNIASVSVITTDCMTADALATSFMVLDPQRSLALTESLARTECLILLRRGEGNFLEYKSSGMADFLEN